MGDTVLSLEDVYVSIGGLEVLRGISLGVQRGETVCIIGRNGAGKTTTLKSILGLVRISRGNITFNGQNITSLPPYKRPLLGIGYAPEDRKIFTELTVKDNIQFASWQLGEDENKFKEKLNWIIEIFPEIEKLLDREGQYLSGGEQKMVAVARALALNPTLLLLDEPFEGLAPSAVERFAESIQRIKKEGISILVAESNVNNATKIADRIYVIERGEIIGHVSRPNEIFENEELVKVVWGAL